MGDPAKVVAWPFAVIGPAAARDDYSRCPDNVVRPELGAETPAHSPADNRHPRAAARCRARSDTRVPEERRCGSIRR